MCSLCATLGGSRYWTDAAGRHEFRSNGGGKVTLRNEREARVTLLNRLLGAYGITINDWGGNSFVLQDRGGRRENVYNLAGIWAAANKMTGGCDPLDRTFLEYLEKIIKAHE
jgi:hypothetical protein